MRDLVFFCCYESGVQSKMKRNYEPESSKSRSIHQWLEEVNNARHISRRDSPLSSKGVKRKRLTLNDTYFSPAISNIRAPSSTSLNTMEETGVRKPRGRPRKAPNEKAARQKPAGMDESAMEEHVHFEAGGPSQSGGELKRKRIGGEVDAEAEDFAAPR